MHKGKFQMPRCKKTHRGDERVLEAAFLHGAAQRPDVPLLGLVTQVLPALIFDGVRLVWCGVVCDAV